MGAAAALRKMGKNSIYKILMYSHDTYGLGHIRRTMAIASHLRSPQVNILILTGSPIVGRFAFPESDRLRPHPGHDQKDQRGIPAAFD